VTADIVKQFQQHLDQAKGFYEVGTKAKIDVTKAEVDLSNARLNLIKAENAVKISWVVLNNAMGMRRRRSIRSRTTWRSISSRSPLTRP